MASSARIDEIKKKFDENPRRYFAPLANEWRKAGDLEQAILICEEFLPQQAGHMSGHIVYGQALFESGRFPEARTVFETALGLDPENLIALRHLGDIAREQGDPVEARRWYDRVLEADPRNEEIQGLLSSLDGGASAPPVPPTPAPQADGAPVAQAESAPAAGFELAAIDLDMDESGFASPAPAAPPAAQPAAPPSATAGDVPFDAISLEGLEPAAAPAAPAPVTPAPSGRAEGLEPSEFEVPTTPLPRAEGLEPAEFEAPTVHAPRAEGLETTEFTAPSTTSTDSSLLDLEGSFGADMGAGSQVAPVAPLPGLEETVATRMPAADEPPLPSLDLDQGLAVPEPALAAPIADVPLGVAAGPGAENPRLEPPAAMEAMPALELGEPIAEGESVAPLPMLELPPAVLAAESKLMDASDEYGEVADAGVGGSAAAPFVTETMAELYLKQGFHAQALDVYRQLAAAAPANARLRERVVTLERGAYPDQEPAGPTVREFLFRLATRQPGQSAAASAPPLSSDFASFDAIPETPIEPAAPPVPAARAPMPWEDEPAAQPANEPVDDAPSDSAPLPFLDTGDDETPAPRAGSPQPDPADTAAPTPSAAERGPLAQGGAAAPAAGTIDALFGGRSSGTSEDSAASALAQAFGGATEAPVITGRPARAAAAELSLDSVFRDGPPRPPRVSQSFSFDQFFSEGAADAPVTGEGSGADAAGEPAERSADDVKQFNSWLQGLKPQ